LQLPNLIRTTTASDRIGNAQAIAYWRVNGCSKAPEKEDFDRFQKPQPPLAAATR